MRPQYHFSVPDNWKNDPQRPIFLDGEYHYYYLYNADYLQGGPGTAWRRATTTDHVTFEDRGVAIPKFSDDNGDCWSGSLVVDELNTAGYGEGAVIALVTQAPQASGQAQYLWYSTDRGQTFHPYGKDPVLANPGVTDFRDPKVIWDADRQRWLMANAEGDRIGFYASNNLRDWDHVGEFVRTDLGLLECPDIFTMTAQDGTRHWILGVSANGKYRDLPATYAYWVGAFDGVRFLPDRDEPQWLDYGFDFYGAVTYEHYEADGALNNSVRHALGWANFWDYPNNTPTSVTDGYNGDDMIVRDLSLRSCGGEYYLASSPTRALADYRGVTSALGDLNVDGDLDLDLHSAAYELTCEVAWDPARPPNQVGLELCRPEGGTRKVVIAVDPGESQVHVDRSETVNPTKGKTTSQVDLPASTVSLQILVDRTSVEVFVGDGRVVHSHRVFPLAGDDGIRIFSHGAPATFKDLTIHELRSIS